MRGPGGFVPRTFRKRCATPQVIRLGSRPADAQGRESLRVFGRGCVEPRSWPLASPTTLSVWWQWVKRFIGFVARLPIDLMGSSVRSILEPVQVLVQTRFSCEAVVHTTWQWANTFRDDPDRVLVLIGLANTVNCVSRGAVLSATRIHFPWLAPWADACYRHDSNLLVGSFQIRSQRGVYSSGIHLALLSSLLPSTHH